MLPIAAEAAEVFNNARRDKPIDCLPDFLVVGIIGTRHCRVISDLGRLIACFQRKYQACHDQLSESEFALRSAFAIHPVARIGTSPDREDPYDRHPQSGMLCAESATFPGEKPR